jgi:enamine deaminase RidA (YjgF/YER057c/UK114 family)
MSATAFSPAPEADLRRTIDPWPWSQGMGYAQAVEVGGRRTLYISGQTAIDETGQIVGVGDMAAQIKQALDNVAVLLAAAGYDIADVVRYDVHTTDVDAYLAASGPVAGRFGGQLPAGGILCQVARLALPPLLVEFTVTAVR